MSRALLLVLSLLPALAFGQGAISGRASGGTCTLNTALPAWATSYRATATTGTGYQCDASLASCVDLGPGTRNYIGSNVAGDILLGPNDAATTTVVRVSGEAILSGKVTANGGVDLYNAGTLSNTLGGAVVVNDGEGLRVACKTSIGTCSSAVENQEVPICGTGGALTRRCVCMGDGTTYAWRNLFNLSAGAGTTTTCPAT